MVTFGEFLYGQGKFGEAETYFRLALAMRQKIFGPSPQVAGNLSDLANTLLQLQQADEAEVLFLRSAQIYEDLDIQDYQYSVLLNSLGHLYTTRSEFQKAEPYYLQCLTLRSQLLGPNNARLGTILANLGVLYSELGQLDQSLHYHQRALAVKKASQGENHPSNAVNLDMVGRTLSYMGRYAEAEAHSRQAMTVLENALGVDHPRTIAAMNNLAALLNRRHAEETDEVLARALAASSSKTGAVESRGVTLFLMAERANRQGRFQESEEWACRAVGELEEANANPGSIAVARSIWGEALMNVGDMDQAEDQLLLGLTQALALYRVAGRLNPILARMKAYEAKRDGAQTAAEQAFRDQMHLATAQLRHRIGGAISW